MNRFRKKKESTFWMKAIASGVASMMIAAQVGSVVQSGQWLYLEVTQAYALTPTEISSGWKPTYAQLSQTMYYDKAKTWVLGKLKNIYNEFNNEIQRGSGADSQKAVSLYGDYLSYVIWILSVGYGESDSGTKKSLFDPDPSMTDLVGFKEAMETLFVMREELVNVENKIINTVDDLANGRISQVNGIAELPSLIDPLDMEEMLIGQFSDYARAYNNLILYYIDASILAIASTYEGFDGTTSTDYDTLVNAVNGFFLSKGEEDKITPLYDAKKDSLMPYLRMYTEVTAALKESRSYGVDNITTDTLSLTGYQREIDVTAWTKMSKVSMSLWEHYNKLQKESTSTGGDDITVDLEKHDLTGGILPLISNAYAINGKITTEDAEYELTDMGYIMLAAGVVYDPFVSKAGNEGYIEVIKKFITSESQRDDVAEIIQRALIYKKPLFVTSVQGTEWADNDEIQSLPVATYNLATLSDMLISQGDNMNVFAMVRGSMEPSEVDNSTWEYVNGIRKDNSDTHVKTETVEEDVDGATVTVETDEIGVTTSKVTIGDSSDKTDNRNVTVAGDTTVGSAVQMTLPVAITTGRTETFSPMNTERDSLMERIGSLTSVIVHNAAQDARTNNLLTASDRELLFVNGLGDIVLADNTIIIPAIANPILYNYGLEPDKQYLVDEPTIGEAVSSGYYVYNAAFMNHYPVVGFSTTNSWMLDMNSTTHNAMTGGTSETSKYIFMGVVTGDCQARTIYEVKDQKIDVNFTGGLNMPTLAIRSFSVSDDANVANSMMALKYARQGTSWFNAVERPFIVRLGGTAANSMSFFPVTQPDSATLDDFATMGSYLTTSAVRYLADKSSNSGNGNSRISRGTIDIERYITDLAGQGLMGTQYTSTIVKNYQVSYAEIVADTGNRILQFFKSIAEFTVDNIGRIDGILSIKNAYDNPFFNIIMRFIQKFYLVIAIVLLLIVAVRFLKGNYSLLYVALIGGICIAGFELYASWMPTLMPSLYNVAVNDVVEDIVWNTVANQSERYEETYADSERMDTVSGELKPYTATITLYRLSNSEIEELSGRYNIDPERINSGETVMLDASAGIFIKGNEIRMSVDKLFANNTMRGMYKSQWQNLMGNEVRDKNFVAPESFAGNNNPYSIQLTSPYASLDTYYMPYAHFERAFMQNLNNFCSLFMLERKNQTYGELSKDAFLVHNFISSGIFVAPGRDDILEMNIQDFSEESIFTKEDLIELCNQVFYPQEDWLNLRTVFEEPSDEMKESLWMQMLQRSGYYDSNWTLDGEKMTDLILYINNQTKKFVMDNYDMLIFLSDENAIKIITLYATTAFTHRVSEPGYWLYPNYINTGDIELQNVMYGCMTTMYDRSYASDGDVVNILAVNYGLFGVILITLITIMSVILTFILGYLVPILYACFGGILIYKLINADNSIGVVKGYVKTTIVTVLIYFVYALGLNLVPMSSYNWFGYLGCALVTLLCLYILFFVLLSLITDFSELGNSTLANNLMRAGDALTRGALRNLRTQSLQVQRSAVRKATEVRTIVQHARTAGIDSYDWMPRQSRSPRPRTYKTSDLHSFYRRGMRDIRLSRLADRIPFKDVRDSFARQRAERGRSQHSDTAERANTLNIRDRR